VAPSTPPTPLFFRAPYRGNKPEKKRYRIRAVPPFAGHIQHDGYVEEYIVLEIARELLAHVASMPQNKKHLTSQIPNDTKRIDWFANLVKDVPNSDAVWENLADSGFDMGQNKLAVYLAYSYPFLTDDTEEKSQEVDLIPIKKESGSPTIPTGNIDLETDGEIDLDLPNDPKSESEWQP
jgi:hypothetical protein